MLLSAAFLGQKDKVLTIVDLRYKVINADTYNGNAIEVDFGWGSRKVFSYENHAKKQS